MRTPRHSTTQHMQTESLNDVSARLRRSERKRNAQVAELAAARAEADRLKSELSSVLARHRVREKAAAEAAAAQREKDRNDAAAAARAATAGLLEPAQQQQLRKRDAIIGRLRDKLEAASGELSEEQVRQLLELTFQFDGAVFIRSRALPCFDQGENPISLQGGYC